MLVAKLCYKSIKENIFFCHHSFMGKSKNEPEKNTTN